MTYRRPLSVRKVGPPEWRMSHAECDAFIAERAKLGGLCACGCGSMVPLATKSRRAFGDVKGYPVRFVLGHLIRRPASGRHYLVMYDPSAKNRSRTNRTHRVLAAAALGKPLPKGVEVHHATLNKRDNSVLVICPSSAYHQLLHRRTRALRASGHPEYLACAYCKRWDEPAAMTLVAGRTNFAYHKQCRTEDARVKRAERRILRPKRARIKNELGQFVGWAPLPESA